MNAENIGRESRLIRIHINREPYEIESPTRNAKLYELADLGPHQELFREVHGDHEDVLLISTRN